MPTGPTPMRRPEPEGSKRPKNIKKVRPYEGGPFLYKENHSLGEWFKKA